MQISLSQDIQTILYWGAKNLVQFNALKRQACNIFHKKSTNTNAITMSGQALQNNDTFNLVGVTFEQDLRWDKHIAPAASKKLSFLFHAKKYFTSSNLYILYVAQIRPSLKNMLSPFAVSLKTSTTSHFDRTFVPRVSWLWNGLHSHVFSLFPNIQTFKTRINKLPPLFHLSHPRYVGI